jgi:hypothetical protein
MLEKKIYRWSALYNAGGSSLVDRDLRRPPIPDYDSDSDSVGVGVGAGNKGISGVGVGVEILATSDKVLLFH